MTIFHRQQKYPCRLVSKPPDNGYSLNRTQPLLKVLTLTLLLGTNQIVDCRSLNGEVSSLKQNQIWGNAYHQIQRQPSRPLNLDRQLINEDKLNEFIQTDSEFQGLFKSEEGELSPDSTLLRSPESRSSQAFSNLRKEILSNQINQCGNGLLDEGELCDAGLKNADDDSYGCTTECEVQVGWQCYAYLASGSSDCYQIPIQGLRNLNINFCKYDISEYDADYPCCGDGYYDTDNYEECDVGFPNVGDGMYCTEKCKLSTNVPFTYRVGYWTNYDSWYTRTTSYFYDASSQCGDGNYDNGEQCDTLIKFDGYNDGCNNDCTFQDTCYNQYYDEDFGKYQVYCSCGDGYYDRSIGEDCDDGNRYDGDGCSITCEREDYWTCVNYSNDWSECEPTCGDGYIIGDEVCDDMDATTYVYATEQNQQGYQQFYSCLSCTSITDTYQCQNLTPDGWYGSGYYWIDGSCQDSCGDNYKDRSYGWTVEECDDGNNIDGDGCSANCIVEDGFYCSWYGDIDGGYDSCTTCGNGRREDGEYCDDGNYADGDGCSHICAVEATYWTCVGGDNGVYTDICMRCGDGYVDDYLEETCDDGNYVNNDGCDQYCQVESGYSYSTGQDGTVTVFYSCGDGYRTSADQCDDKNLVNGDGCSANCRVEDGWKCVDDVNFSSVGDTCTFVCGNSVVNDSEDCDDGNYVAGDGCSATCQLETGWLCSTPGQACTPICGDDMKVGAEACDDGNAVSNDGCSSTCLTLEHGFTCPTLGEDCIPTCGDAYFVSGEACDDGNTVAGDGCYKDCSYMEDGFTCTLSVSTNKHTCVSVCGDGLKVGTETCDDGNSVSGDGCSSTCQIETGYRCPNPNTACQTICGDGIITGHEYCDDGDTSSISGCNGQCTDWVTGYQCTTNSAQKSICHKMCGDGDYDLYSGEHCDDGNTTPGDGCDASCNYEDGWTCTRATTTAITVCLPICGDGLLLGAEVCDDDNSVSGDGCSSTCRTIESGYECNQVGSACTTKCGDGIKLSAEACDDGNRIAGDGCSSKCKIESGWRCIGDTLSQSTCYMNCGDGIRQTGEECDDGNRLILDGCDNYCVVENGYTCTGGESGHTKDLCTWTCGDGVWDSDTEECDDGNYVNDDGCSNTCEADGGYTCYSVDDWTGSRCDIQCGDGAKAYSEECDDGNNTDGDGCDVDCYLESGYEAVGDYEAGVVPICGDGVYLDGEACDDGDSDNSDGCTTTCQLAFGYTCTGSPSSCSITCGNNVRDYGEECDNDSSRTSGDGCSSNCYVENGYTCTGGTPSTPDTCVFSCGNSIVTSGSEECDDGNYVSGDGCSNTCQVESGWTCETFDGLQDSECTTTCGDGILITAASEECDDGNTLDGDGCSSTCKIESYLWTCANAGSLCATTCGDGHRSAYEQCDDGNTNDMDGCSSSCNVENGYKCQASTNVNGKDKCTAVSTGSLTTGSYSDCLEFISNFQVTHDTSTLPLRDAVYNEVQASPLNSYCEATSPNKICPNWLDECQFTRMLALKCSVVNGQTRIRIQTNSMPDHCFYSPIYMKYGVYTDFEVAFSAQIDGQSSVNPTTQAATDSMFCWTRASGSSFPSGGIQTRYNYAQKTTTTDRYAVGVALNGVLIYSGVSNGQDAFNPATGTALSTVLDQCLGYIDQANLNYRYYSYSPCIFTSTLKGSTDIQRCSTDTDCSDDALTYSQDETSSTFQTLTVVGLAKDGHKIYGPFKEDGSIWQANEVDICNGRLIDGEYAYVMTMFFPYTIGCWGPGASTTTYAPSCTTNPKSLHKNDIIGSNAYSMQSIYGIIIGMVSMFAMMME